MSTFAFTLPTGKIGTHLTATAQAIEARPLGRPGFDWGDPATFARSLEGVGILFANPLPGPDQAEREAELYAAAKAAGVGHVIKLSVTGAGHHHFGMGHADGERRLAQSGLPFTILRPTFFMQNALGLAQAIAGGTYPAAMGAAAMSQIDARDIAAAVLAIVGDPAPHVGRTYELTGSQTFTGEAFAATFAEALGHAVRYVDLPEDALRATLEQSGLDAWYVEGLLDLYRYVRRGDAARVYPDLKALLKREPRTLAQFAREHADAFRSA